MARFSVGAFGAAGMLLAAVLLSPTWAEAQTGFGTSESSDSNRSERRRAARRDRAAPPVSRQVLVSPATDAAIGKAIQRYERIVAAGGWARIPAGRKLEYGDRDKRVALLRRRLLATGELAAGGRASRGFDRDLHGAVVRFQVRHGLTPSGEVNRYTLRALNVPAAQRLNQLRLNRRRLRGVLARTKGKSYIIVNIPGYELQAVAGGTLQLASRVVAGKPTTRTPEVSAAVRAVNFLPYWHVPQSIANRALIPTVKKDPDYLG